MTTNRCFCGLPGITIYDLFGKTVSGKSRLETTSRRIYYTHKGRFGLGFLCQYWSLQQRDQVLVPAYNCGSEIDPFLYYGLDVVFYRVDQKAVIDFEDLMRRITPRTKIVYVTHYFGWPQNINALSDYCRKNNIYLIEDCALSLFSNPVDFPVGILGDAAIYSFPKTLPVPDGGAVSVPINMQLSGISMQKPPCSSIFKKMLPLIKRSVLRGVDKIKIYPYLPNCLSQSRGDAKRVVLKTQAGLPEMPSSYYYDKKMETYSASAITQHILRHTCSDEVVRRRRSNYVLLYGALMELENIRPLFQELQEGVCPLYLPLLVEDRDAVACRLNREGISAISWWAGFHRAFDWTEFPEVKYLKEHVLAIPVHQQLTRRNINYISSILKRVDMGRQ